VDTGKPGKDLRETHKKRAPTLPVPGKLDPGIKRAVELLQAHNIETYESCQGGPGHCYPEPTVRFYGTPEAGWRAASVCLTYGLPIDALRRAWSVQDGIELVGPHWEITFRRQLD